MRVKVERTDEIIECDYEPECVIWTDDAGPYTYYTSIPEWMESMLDNDDTWFGTHNDTAFLSECCDELKDGHNIHLRWYIMDTWPRTYNETGANFFVSPLYIDVETDDWYYPNEVKVVE